MSDVPALVLCARGTRHAAGRATVEAIRAGAARRLPRTDVCVGYVDVQVPRIDRVVAERAAGHAPVVVVPLLLCHGYHVGVDIELAVSPFAAAVSTGGLGPDPVLADVVLDRLHEAGARPGDAVVLAAAGSARMRTTRDAEAAAAALAVHWPGPVTVGFTAPAGPSARDAVEAAREEGAGRVHLASYLLGRGLAHTQLLSAGADLVTEPIGADRRVVDLVLRRYAAGCARLAARHLERTG